MNYNNLSDNIFSDYIKEIKKYPKLSYKELYLLFEELNNGNKEAFNKIYNSNLAMVVTIVKSVYVSCYSIPIMDLIQEGNMGLIQAINTFNYKLGFAFSTYAYPVIENSIKSLLMLLERPYKINDVISAKYKIFQNKLIEMTNRLNREPTFDEMAEELNMSKYYINKMYQMMLPTYALNHGYIEDETGLFIEGDEYITVDSEFSENILDNIYNLEKKEAILKIFEEVKLTKRQIQILNLRYGLDGNEPMKGIEIAKLLNKSKQAISIVEKMALKKIRKSVYVDYLAQFRDDPEKSLEQMKTLLKKQTTK